MALRTIILTCLFILKASFSNAQYSFKNIKSNWQATWICPPAPNDTLPNTWLCWRKSFNFSEKIPPSVKAHIAVDSKYWLYINGEMVVSEGQLKRGPYIEKYILEAYFKMNDASKGIERMKKRYQKMVESPITTLWEGWEVGSATYGGGTYNHGWTGGTLTLMSQYIAGLMPDTEGYKTFKGFPQPVDLTYFKMGAETVRKNAQIEWQRTGEKAVLSVKTPNCSGKIGIPKVFPISKIVSNGKIIWMKNYLKAQKTPITEVKFLEETAEYLVFEVVSGSYKFEIN